MAGPGKQVGPGQEIARVTCLICEKPLESQKAFTCRRCRKSPFCFEHLDREYKVCLGCAAEERMRGYRALVGQERSLKVFFRFTQFVVVLALFMFAFDRFFSDQIPESLKSNIFLEYDLYLYFGGAALAGMVFCYVLILSQKQKMKEVQDKIDGHKTDSKYMFR